MTLQFPDAMHTSKVNCDEMSRDRPRQPVNRNCYRLSCILALAQIACSKYQFIYTNWHTKHEQQQ